MAKKIVSFTIDEDVVERIQALAIEQDRPVSRIVNATLTTAFPGEPVVVGKVTA